MKRLKHLLKRHPKKLAALSIILLVWLLCLPAQLFKDPLSTVIEDNQGRLLGAKIADDGQWRFPACDTVPDKFARSIILFEDEYFYWHPGFNPVSFCRALVQDIKARSVVSGGSTITMQVIRLARKGQSRTIFEKIIEVFMATRLELTHSKQEILAMYASYAPFGGNVVGLDAAAWRYFGRNASQLSWAEAATLAVLPNAPALIHPGKNREQLIAKRNRLLQKLKEKGYINEEDLKLALLEPLPDKPVPIPQVAPHLLTRLFIEHKGERIQTTLNRARQLEVNRIVREHLINLEANQIFNAAVIVMDVVTGDVIAYVGNNPDMQDEEHGNHVDVITAPRSTGSILKPFLYASMLDEGRLLPTTLVADVPTFYGSYAPKNYDHSYHGAIPARFALSRSLNVPAVRMLRDYGTQEFKLKLQKLGITTVDKPADHYGLSLILGGAEASLWELCGVYASMARSLEHYTEYDSRYFAEDYAMPNIYMDQSKRGHKGAPGKKQKTGVMGAGAIYDMFQAMIEVTRPGVDASWRSFSSSKNIAWKTGTSFGYRDAWAIGVTPKYVVGVWVGNADGEGRPGIVGSVAAAPILFDVFDMLPGSQWFDQPYDDMSYIAVCSKSGHRPGVNCGEVDSVWAPVAGLRSVACPYHQIVHVDPTGSYRVTDACMPVANMVEKSWFVLPPKMEWYYKNIDPTYVSLPPWMAGCEPKEDYVAMNIISPRPDAIVYVPVGYTGEKSQVVFQLALRQSNTTVFWHLDDQYIGSTTQFHQFGMTPAPGEHTLTVVDEAGNSVSRHFTVLAK